MNWKTRYFWGMAIVAVLVAAIPAAAQPTPAPAKPEESFYRLDFVLQELEGAKVINTRSYSMWMSSADGRGAGASVRAGNEIPIVTATATPEKPASVSYRNVGVRIDCRLTESANGPILYMSGSINNVVPPEQAPDAKMVLPVFRSIDVNAYTLLALGKATLISSADDPSSKRRFDLQVTATKLK